jgi:hypothetical protein
MLGRSYEGRKIKLCGPRMTAAAQTRDRAWLAILAASFAFGLAVSWHRWGNPLIDTGREMNQPLRLMGGEMLYSDLRHIYGPLSPWLHAVLFHVFGPSLTVLYTDGIISAIMILALVYWLGRQIMSPAAAGAATLNVMWLCVFKPAGIYILPYSYNSLHGTALGLITLAILTAALKRGRDPTHPVSVMPFLLAGMVAGLAILAKTEMGLATQAAGVTAAVVAAYPDVRRGARFAAVFVASAGCLAVGVYAIIAARVGWSTLVSDNWLLLYNMAPELTYYNRRISGFDHPLRSLGRILIATIKLGILGAIVGAISSLIGGARPARGQPDGEARGSVRRAVSRPWYVLGAAVALLIVMAVTTGLDWDKGPYLAMPFLLAGLLLMLTGRLRAEAASKRSARIPILIVYAVYALASLARMILHVRSGGAYGSFLLPMSVVIFTYLWVGPFADRFREGRARHVARTIALTLLVAVAVVNAGVLAYRYRTRNTVVVATARGTIIAEPDVGQAWNEALVYIDRYTRPGDAVAVMPEGTSLDFLSGRRNPLREEITTPGFLDTAGETRAIRQLQEAHTGLILITNRTTAEFGPAVFGRDYNQRLMHWIEAHYTACAIFGPVKYRNLQIGDRPFFIRAYCAREMAPTSHLFQPSSRRAHDIAALGGLSSQVWHERTRHLIRQN